MLEISGNTRAWISEEYQGVGTIGLSFVRDNDTNIIPNATQRESTKDYIIEHEDPITGETVGAPVTATPGIYMIELSLLSLDFSIASAIDPAYDPAETSRGAIQHRIPCCSKKWQVAFATSLSLLE